MKRVLIWVLAIGVFVVVLNVVLRQVFPVTTVAEVNRNPQAYEGRIVGLHVVRGTNATSATGVALSVLQDASGVDMACVGTPSLGSVWVKISQVQVLGKTLTVGQPQGYGNRLVLLATYLFDVATDEPDEPGAAPAGQKPGEKECMRRGEVISTGSWAGVPVLVFRGEDGEKLTVLTVDPAPPAGTEVAFVPQRVSGIGLAIYETQVVVTQLYSLIENCSKFEGNTITVEGRVCPGISLLGSSAFGLEDEAGRSVLVLGRDLPKPSTEYARVRGRVQVLMDSRAAKLVFVHGLRIDEIKAEQEAEDCGSPEEATAVEGKLGPSSAPADGGDAQ